MPTRGMYWSMVSVLAHRICVHSVHMHAGTVRAYRGGMRHVLGACHALHHLCHAAEHFCHAQHQVGGGRCRGESRHAATANPHLVSCSASTHNTAEAEHPTCKCIHCFAPSLPTKDTFISKPSCSSMAPAIWDRILSRVSGGSCRGERERAAHREAQLMALVCRRKQAPQRTSSSGKGCRVRSNTGAAG